MKKRTNGFIAEEDISHDSEIFDYIKELHEYLWRFVRCVLPSANGTLTNYIDIAIRELEYQKHKKETE